jgi:hypothetical protein
LAAGFLPNVMNFSGNSDLRHCWVRVAGWQISPVG